MRFSLAFIKELSINYTLIRKFTGMVICIIISAFILSYDFLHLPTLSSDQIAPIDIKSPRDFKYEDRLATGNFEEMAQEKVEKIYTMDEEVLPRVEKELRKFFRDLEDNTQVDDNTPDKLKDIYRGFRTLSSYRIFELKAVIFDLIKKILEEGYREEDRMMIFNALRRKVNAMNMLSDDEKILIQQTISYFIQPNMTLDRKATELLRKKARERIQPVQKFIKKGEIIIREGEIVDENVISILRQMDYFDENIHFIQRFTGYLFLFIFFSLILYLYLHHFNPDIIAEEQLVLFIEMIALFSIAGFRVYSVLLASEVNMIFAGQVLPLFSIYLLPVAAVAMLVSLVVDSKFSILLSSMLAVIGGLVLKEIDFVVVAIIGSIVSVYTIMSAKTRAEQLLSGLYLIITNICLIIALHFINMRFITIGQDIKFLLRDVLSGFVNGMFSIIFAMGTMPIFEKLFRVTSALRLLELTDLNNKLLKELLEQAPGTYHHSIMVANLAEAAAIEIGADSLLARIGGYYHDIGKIKRPFFFVENLMGRDNQHKDLNANLSSIIITSHTKDGVEIAKQHNLPSEVIDIISQHHGTTLVKFFYDKARKEHGDDIRESQFRYPGPKPQTREAALVMLADSIESATRSLSAATPSSIDNLIRKITNEKFVDEQFDECNLTLKEIDKIRNVFSKVLLQMFHKRIEYPDMKLQGQGVFK
ncbi:MAG: HD family phosphohydrolase [Candidatus Muiribacteriaceae bacterium]